MRIRSSRSLSLLIVLPLAVALAGAPALADTPSDNPSDTISSTVGGLVDHLTHGEALDALDTAEGLIDQVTDPAAPTASAPGDLTSALTQLAAAVPSLHGADRARAKAILARPTADTTGVDLIDYSYTEDQSLERRCSTHFCVTYTTAVGASNYVNQYGDRLDNSATAAEASRDLSVLEHVYSVETGTLGFRKPRSDAATSNGSFTNYDSRFDVFLSDIGAGGYYGYCAPDSGVSATSSAYCVLDNDFARSEFHTTPSRARDVTAAHEFFHAIQYAYRIGEPYWFSEGTAVWMEDIVYNSINDYLQYLPASPIRKPLVPFTSNGGFARYGAFAIFKFLTAHYSDRAFVRKMWERAAAGQGPLGAMKTVLGAHHSGFKAAAREFGIWNTLRTHTYPERKSYKPAGWWKTPTLKKSHTSTGKKHVAIKPLATAPVRLTPGKGLKKRARIKIHVDGPGKGHTPVVRVQIRKRNGHVATKTFKLGRRGNGTHSYDFNRRKVSSVVVTMTNATYEGKAQRFVFKAKVK